jgi:hypothetical protein
MERPFPFCWAAAFNAPVGPMTWCGWPGPLPGEPAVDDSCVGLTALDNKLVRLVSEVLVESVNCTICGAQLIERSTCNSGADTSMAPGSSLQLIAVDGGGTVIWRESSKQPVICTLGNSVPTDWTREHQKMEENPASPGCRAVETCRPALKWPTSAAQR